MSKDFFDARFQRDYGLSESSRRGDISNQARYILLDDMGRWERRGRGTMGIDSKAFLDNERPMLWEISYQAMFMLKVSNNYLTGLS